MYEHDSTVHNGATCSRRLEMRRNNYVYLRIVGCVSSQAKSTIADLKEYAQVCSVPGENSFSASTIGEPAAPCVIIVLEYKMQGHESIWFANKLDDNIQDIESRLRPRKLPIHPIWTNFTIACCLRIAIIAIMFD